MRNSIRVAFLGCGRVAEHYRYLLLERDPISEFLVVACCDLDPQKAEKFAKLFECRSFTSINEMLSAGGFDLLLILTPSGSHFKNAKFALEEGFNVLIEKPITLNVEHALELKALAIEKNLLCASVFQNRFNLAIQALKKAMDLGRFGKIITATMRLRWCRLQNYYEDGWHGTWANDGGVINQQAIHHIDALNWICGPVDAVVARMANRMNVLEAEDTMVGLVHFNNGALGTIEATTAARPHDYEASLSIVGERGMVQIGGIALNKIETWNFIEEYPEDQAIYESCNEEVPTGYGLSHTRLLRELITVLHGGEAILIDVDEALEAVKLVNALYSSIEDQRWVSMSEQPISKRLGKG